MQYKDTKGRSDEAEFWRKMADDHLPINSVRASHLRETPQASEELFIKGYPSLRTQKNEYTNLI